MTADCLAAGKFVHAPVLYLWHKKSALRLYPVVGEEVSSLLLLFSAFFHEVQLKYPVATDPKKTPVAWAGTEDDGGGGGDGDDDDTEVFFNLQQ